MAQSLCQNLKLCMEKQKLPGIKKRLVKRKVHYTFGSRSGFLSTNMESKLLFHTKRMRTSQKQHGKMLLEVKATLEEHSKLLPEVKVNGKMLKLMLENLYEILLKLKAMQEEHSKMLPEVKATQEEHGKMLPDVKVMQEKHGKMLPEVKATQEEHGKILLGVQATQEEHGKILQDVKATQEEHSKVLPEVKATQEENGKMLLDVKATQKEHGKVLPEVKATQEELRKMTQEVKVTLAEKGKSFRNRFYGPIENLQLSGDGGNTIIFNNAPDARQNFEDVYLRPEDAVTALSTSVLPLDVQTTAEKDQSKPTALYDIDDGGSLSGLSGLSGVICTSDDKDHSQYSISKSIPLGSAVDDGSHSGKKGAVVVETSEGLSVACSDASSQLAKGLEVSEREADADSSPYRMNIQVEKMFPEEKTTGVPRMPESVENKCEESVMMAIGSYGGGGDRSWSSVLDTVPAAYKIGCPERSQSAFPVESESVCYGFKMMEGSLRAVLFDHAYSGSWKQCPEGSDTFPSSVAMNSDKPGSERSFSASGPDIVEGGSLSATLQASKRMKGFARSLSDSGSVKAGSGSVKAGSGIKLPDTVHKSEHAWSDITGIKGSLSTSYPDLMQINCDKLQYEGSFCASVAFSEEADRGNDTQSGSMLSDNDIRSQSPSLAHTSQTVSGIKESEESLSTPQFELKSSGDAIKLLGAFHVATLSDSVMTGIGMEEWSNSASVSGVESGIDNAQVSEGCQLVMSDSAQGCNDIEGPQSVVSPLSDSAQSDYDTIKTAGSPSAF